VEKALRESSARGEKCIFQPKEGQVFQTIEEAYEFFNMYSFWICVRWGEKNVEERQTDGAPRTYGRDWKSFQKLVEPLWGERESFGKFSKDGSVFACMERMTTKTKANLGKKTKVVV
jgi:hypothetical protein